MPYFFDPNHYARIVAILKAGEAEASAYSNPATRGVKVELEDGSTAAWSNSENQCWALVLVDPDGNVRATLDTSLRMDTDPDVVAQFIATFDYDAVKSDKTEEQKRIDQTEPVAETTVLEEEV